MTKPDFTQDAYSMKREINKLKQQLAKANERVNELEQVATEYEFLIADLVRRADVKNDLYRNPTYKKASERLNKFAIEKKIEGAFKYSDFLDSNNFSSAIAARESGFFQLAETFAEQLRKEQEK